jgi:hypothetical protein
LKTALEDLGGPIFISYVFFDFFMVLISVLTTLVQGAEANKLDSELKNWLMHLQRDLLIINDIARSGRFVERQHNKLEILSKESQRKEKGQNLNLNQEMMDNIEDINEKREYVIEQLEYKMQNDQYVLLGEAINYGQVLSILSTTGTAIGIIGQELLGGGSDLLL